VSDHKNFIAGVASSGWTAVVGLLAMPFYIKLLGISSYGMVGIYLTLQGLFALLDLGFSPAVSREVARLRAMGEHERVRAVVHSMATIFTACGGIAAIGLGICAPWLARGWIGGGELPLSEVTLALALSALSIGARWPGTSYIGVLTGARRIDVASAVTIGSTTFANFGAVAVLVVIEPSLRAFFVWQVIAGAVHSMMMRYMAWRVLGKRTSGFNWDAVKSIWRFTAGMAVVAGTGVIFANSDRLVLAKTSTLGQVGRYTIAVTLAGLLYRLIIPAFNVIYPKLSEQFAAHTLAEVRAFYYNSTRLFLTLLCPAAVFLIVFARPLLAIWLNDPMLSAQTHSIVSILACGTAIHCVMYFPFALQIARGNTRIPTLTNLILVVVFIPMLFLLSSAYQARGAAIAWLILHSFYFVLGTYLTGKYILPGAGLAWIRHALLRPLAISLGFGTVAYLAQSVVDSAMAQLCIGVFFAGMAAASGLALLPERQAMLKRARLGYRRE
jgi:O-antigen/teichoic acid export membrane protein